MKEVTSNLLLIILTVVFGMYVISNLVFFIEKIIKNIAFSSKSKRPFHVWVRRFYWPHVKRFIRTYATTHCQYIPYIGNTVCCIAMYELDRESFREDYITGGIDKLKIKVLTKTEEITKFVIDWRGHYQYATSEEILSLYLIENKNQ